MTTPTTMITSKITTVTTMMTDVVVTPSLGTLLEGCVLLLELTGAVSVVVIALSVLDAEVPSSAQQKHTTWHVTWNKETQKHSSADNTNDFSMML